MKKANKKMNARTKNDRWRREKSEIITRKKVYLYCGDIEK